jgi:glutamyl-tRNA reductase
MLAQEGMDLRTQELEKAFRLLDKLLNDYLKNQNTKNVPLTISLKNLFDDTKSKELEKAIKDIQKGIDPKEVCEKLARNLTKKLLHFPTKSINEDKNNAKLIKQIYKLKD